MLPLFCDGIDMSVFVPIVDISGLSSRDTALKKRIAKQIRTTAENSGFFYVEGHGIDPEIIDQAFATAKRFFKLSAAEKSEVNVNDKQRGWMPQGMAKLEGAKTADAKEVFFWGWDIGPCDNDLKAEAPMVALNQWPNQNAPWLKPELLSYYHRACDVGKQIMGALALSFDLPQSYFDRFYQSPLARGQMVYYPPLELSAEKGEQFSAAPHTDFGVLTLLLQDKNGGLQVRDKIGNWIDAPPVSGSLVCNIGDLLQRWTNKKLASTVHRVINRSGNERYSIPIFFDPNSRTVIDPADFLSPGETALFEPVTAGEHIAGRNKKNFSQYTKKG